MKGAFHSVETVDNLVRVLLDLLLELNINFSGSEKRIPCT